VNGKGHIGIVAPLSVTIASMDKPKHPKVIRPWKVERIRKPGGASSKVYQPKPSKKKRAG